MNALVEHIREGIADRGSGNVFDHVLDAYWPIDGSSGGNQQRAILRFAARHGWQVEFLREGKWSKFWREAPG